MFFGVYVSIFLTILFSVCYGNIAKPNVTFHLQEELPNRTLIGNLIRETDLLSKYNQSQSPSFQFTFLKKAEPIISLFYIDSVTSQLYTNTIIDREKEGVCKYKITCYFEFDVAVISAVLQVIKVGINITDQNDNTPTFPAYTNNQVSFNLTENLPKDSFRHIDPAQDLDTGYGNSIQSYELLPMNETDFKLVIGENSELNLVVENKLDHERRSLYKLYLIARDGGKPVRTGTLSITVNILDENDNWPIFKVREKNLTIREDTPQNSVIYTMTATDKDSGKNGQIVYKLKDFQLEEINDLFSIDQNSGEIRVISKLVYEPGKVYDVHIVASDNGNNPNSASAVVHINIEDTGNNPPKITVNFLRPGATDKQVEISENSTINHFVAYIDAEDTDTGANGDVSCSTYSTYFGLSIIQNTPNYKGYNVIVQHELDREKQSEHSVIINCRDKGTPMLEATASFIVKLRDENDNPPRFSKYFYSTEMSENNKIGDTVIQVNATDKDIGPNGEIRYAMKPSTDKRFQVHPLTGLVTANMIFDRETTAHVTFEVVAMDNGKPKPLSSVATVVVDILDLNDKKPDFLKTIFQFQIRENVSPGTTVGFVSAVDEDQGANGEITYSLPSNFNKSSIPFIVLHTGEIKTNGSLNREIQRRYDFYVAARDNGTTPLNSTSHVVVFIQDENDNVPQFMFPNKENHTVVIPNTINVDSIIASLQAFDIDDGENGNVMFFIRSGDDDGIFYLDHATGSLYVKKIVNTLKDKVYNLTIQVTDRGSPVKSVQQNLIVIVRYVNVTTEPHVIQETDKFVLIAVSVVCVTFVLSMGLIAVICLLKRREDDKKKASQLFPARTAVSTAPNLYDCPPSVTHDNKENSLIDGRVKNKVSFSLDTDNPKETFTKMQLLEKYAGSMNGETSLKNKPPDYIDAYDKNLNPNPHHHGNNKYINQSSKQPQHQNKHTREESPSETSGETMTSQDSGRGSEEDFNGHNETQTFEPLFVPGKDTHPSIFVMRQHSRNSHTDIPGKTNTLEKIVPQRQTSSQDNNSNDSLLTTSFNSMWSEPSHHNLKNIGTLPTVPSISAWTGFQNNDNKYGGLFYKDGTLGSHSAHSRDDDECTTTSGSYTINEDDLELDFPTRPRDLFV